MSDNKNGKNLSYMLQHQELNKILDIINQVENEADIDSVKRYLDQRIQDLKMELDDYDAGEQTEEYKILRESKVLTENEIISLQLLEADFRENYVAVRKENADFPKMYDDKKYLEYVWEDAIDDSALNCAIIRKVDNVFLGYCCIKNMNKEEWEIAIELFKRWQRQGYGYSAINLFMKHISNVCGKNVFMTKVEADNVASQALMDKLGAVPDGVTEFLIHSEEELKKVEEEYAGCIDDRMIELAKKFEVEPKKLLSHVLKYKIDV